MTTLLVNLGGLATIAWIVWHFFVARRSTEARAEAVGDVQEIQVVVKGGYHPDVLRAAPGVPIRVRFRREETSACSEEVVFPDFGVRTFLPAFETTTVDLPAVASGRYRFACGMDMLHGAVVVGDALGATPVEPAPAAVDEPTFLDPICGMSVRPSRAAATSNKGGQTVYFCGVSCKERFDAGQSGPPPGHDSHGVVRSMPVRLERRKP